MCFTIARPRPVPRDERAVSAAVEALEEAVELARGHARAVVRDGEHGSRAGVADRHAARAAGPGVADRVRDEVLGDDAQHARPQRQLDLLAAADLERHLRVQRRGPRSADATS